MNETLVAPFPILRRCIAISGILALGWATAPDAQTVDYSIFVGGFEPVQRDSSPKNSGGNPLFVPRATIDIAIPDELRFLFPEGEDPLIELAPQSCALRNNQSERVSGAEVANRIVFSDFNESGKVDTETVDEGSDGAMDMRVEARYDQHSNILSERVDSGADGEVDAETSYLWTYSAFPTDPPGTVVHVVATYDLNALVTGEEFAVAVSYFRNPATGLMQSEEWSRSAPGTTTTFVPFASALYGYDLAGNLSRYTLDPVNPLSPSLQYDFVWNMDNALEQFKVSLLLDNGTRLVQGVDREYRYTPSGDLDQVLIDPDAKNDEYAGETFSYDLSATYRRTGIGNVMQIDTRPLRAVGPGLCSTTERFTWTPLGSALEYTRDDGTIADCNDMDGIPEQVDLYSGSCIQ